MTTPRRPYGPDDRETPGWDPRRPDPYAVDAHANDTDDDDGTAMWGRAPAGGWGAADDGYGRPDAYSGESHYGEPRYREPRYDEPRYAEPRYEEPRYEEPGEEPRSGVSRYGGPPKRSTGSGRDRRGARDASRSGADRYAEASHDRYEPAWSQGPAVTPRRAVRRRRRPPWVALAAAGVVLVAVLVLGFVTPGWFVTRVLDADAVQTGVTKILTDDFGLDGIGDVRCPAGIQVVAGATFTCDATVDGDPVKVPVKVTDGKGAYEVGRPA